MEKRKTLSQLKKELDRVYSIYIRTKYSRDGLVQCYTCGAVNEIGRTDCGHFWSRRYGNTRWDEQNTRPQCRKCNRYQEGNKPAFANALVREYGDGILEDLEIRAKAPFKYNRLEIEKYIQEYKTKLRRLK